MAKPVRSAVITADVIGSSALQPAERKKLQQLMEAFTADATTQWTDLRAEQFRGDSLQIVLTENRHQSLRITLLLQSFLAREKFYIRASIGIGTVSFADKKVVTSDGTAFQASGTHLDELKKRSEVISIAGEQDAFTAEWQVHSSSLSYFVQNWSVHQAEAIYLQLQQRTQEQIAEKLNISQPSVYQRLQLAGGNVVQKILARFELVVPGL